MKTRVYGEPSRNLSPWTVKERKLIDLLANNQPLKVAAPASGFAQREAAVFLARADVKVALHQHRRAYLLGNLVPKSLQCALTLLEDDETPASVRSKLSAAVLSMAQRSEDADAINDDKPQSLDNMSPEDLADFAASLRREIETQRMTIEGEIVENPKHSQIDDLF